MTTTRAATPPVRPPRSKALSASTSRFGSIERAYAHEWERASPRLQLDWSARIDRSPRQLNASAVDFLGATANFERAEAS